MCIVASLLYSNNDSISDSTSHAIAHMHDDFTRSRNLVMDCFTDIIIIIADLTAGLRN